MSEKPRVVKIIGTTKVYDQGKTTIPTKIRQRKNLKEGDEVQWIEWLPGSYVLESAQPPKYRPMQ